MGRLCLAQLLVLLGLRAGSAEEYQYVKLVSKSSTGGAQFCVGELELYDSYRKISLTEYESCSASSTAAGSSCENAFQGNGDAAIGFCSDPASALLSAGLALDGAAGNLIVFMAPGDDVTKFKITALSSGGASTAPTEFDLYGSNGGGTWTLLHSEDSLSWTDGETKTFFVDGSCDAKDRWGTGDNDFNSNCASRAYGPCTGAYASICEWKEETYLGSCVEILLDGVTEDGEYEILVEGTNEVVTVYCAMSIGGWTRVLNMPGTASQSSILSTAAIGSSADDSVVYKLADTTINSLMGDDTTVQYRCGAVDYFVTRAAGWVTAINMDGWQVDRDMDGTPDCSASRTGYIFSDYLADNTSPLAGASIDSCASVGHTDFGYAAGSDLGCYNSDSDWGNDAEVYVRGVASGVTFVDSCADLLADDWTGIYLTRYGAVYCNQDLDGGGITGGWTLLMKTTTSGNLLQYDADYWTTTNTLNADSLFTYPVDFKPQQAKLETFNGNHAGYRILFNEYLAYWPSFSGSGSKTWYIGIFESLTALEFFQTPRTISNDATAEVDFNGDYFSSEATYGKSGIANSGIDSNSNVRWGYVFAGSSTGSNVRALGGIGLDSLSFVNGLSSGDLTQSGVSTVATNSAAGAATSYPVELYGRVYSGETYDSCSELGADDMVGAPGVTYTSEVKPLFCNNDLLNGGWTMLFKTKGVGTAVTYTSTYVQSGTLLANDPAIDSYNMNAEDAVLWTYTTLDVDQLLFYYPASGSSFLTGQFATPSTGQEYLSTYSTYHASAPLTTAATVVFGRKYYDGGVCARPELQDCTAKYLADSVVENILVSSPAPSPLFEATFTSNGYTPVGSSCNAPNVLSTSSTLGYATTGSIGASIVACAALCDANSACLGLQLGASSCALVNDVSFADSDAASPTASSLAVTSGDICYSKIDPVYTTAPPPMWDELPDSVYLTPGSFDGWGLWDSDAATSYQYCADSPVVSTCSSTSLYDCLALCEGNAAAQYCSFGAYASSGTMENNQGEAGGSECCLATATCNQLSTSSGTQKAHYAIYQRLYQQDSTKRGCQTSADCNEAYYCAAYLLQADAGSANAASFLGTQIADTMVACLPCVDAAGVTCAEWGDAIDSCATCANYQEKADMPVVKRACGLNEYTNQLGDCLPCTTSCEEGYYMTGPVCTGTQTTDTVSCVPCISDCGLGKYKVGECSGTGTTSAVTCASCVSSCGEGNYLDYSLVTESSPCLGTGSQTPVCAACTSRCNEGFYLLGTCSGTGTENSVSCAQCSNECEAGQYVDHICSGSGTTDDTSCVDCISSCDSDEYMLGTCDGKGTSDNIRCQKCNMVCPSGQYYSARCDGTTTTDPLVCTACTTSCSTGFFMKGSCDGYGDSNDVTCTACSQCTTGVLQSDGFNCEATCISSVVAAISQSDTVNANTVTGPYSFIGAGIQNQATAPYATIGTGVLNVAAAPWAVIAAGSFNKIAVGGDYSTILGGESNTVLSEYSFIGGGTNNLIQDNSEYSVIGGGTFNNILGKYNVIHGGESNTIYGSSTKNVIGGGIYNIMEGTGSAILGGRQNTIADANYAVILGGRENVILSGANFAVVGGGYKNTVTGKSALAVGSKASSRADNTATFGFQSAACETRAARVVNFCADEVAINGEAVLTLFVRRRRALAEDDQAALQAVAATIFSQEAELKALDAEMDSMLLEIDQLVVAASAARE